MFKKNSAKLLRSKITFRTKLTLTYSVLLTVFGFLTISGVYFFMKFVPNYEFFDNSDAEKQENPILEKNELDNRKFVSEITSEGYANSYPRNDFLGVEGAGEHGSVFALESIVLNVKSSSDMLNILLLISLVVMLLMIFAGSLASWLLAKRLLTPLQVINNAANLAATGTLDHRIELRGPADELHDLSDTFNNMLCKLEKSFLAQQRFTANASHELRTPLSTTKVLVDVVLSDPQAGRDILAETLQRVKETNEKNIVLVETLLDLSVTNVDVASFVDVELVSVVSQAVEDMRHDFVESEVNLLFADQDKKVEQVVWGDAVLLQRLFFNLLQNAVRYNVCGGLVVVDFFVERGGVKVCVSNTGKVFSQNEVEVFVEPFFRKAGRISGGFRDKSYGLGLTLVANIVELHGGDLRIVANPDGGIMVEVFLLGKDFFESGGVGV